MARGKRKLIRRQDFRPAVWLNLTGARPLTQVLESLEQKNSQHGRRCGRAYRSKPPRAAETKHEEAQPVPNPAVAQTRRGDRPDANPPWSSPPVHPPHQPVIAALDASPKAARHGHCLTSYERLKANRLASACPIRLETGIDVP